MPPPNHNVQHLRAIHPNEPKPPYKPHQNPTTTEKHSAQLPTEPNTMNPATREPTELLNNDPPKPNTRPNCKTQPIVTYEYTRITTTEQNPQ
ncbi:hypothetical protein RRF57_013027 [Xylaria bambusicola]|uniref:Uncharacterized protein n=1 Tax=Xylaria bambusicola TaxID=326684 RepID=A0AAN7UR18_9PEZI